LKKTIFQPFYFRRLANQSGTQSVTKSNKTSITISPIKLGDSTIISRNIVFLKRIAKEKTFCKTKFIFVAKGLDICFDEPNRF